MSNEQNNQENEEIQMMKESGNDNAEYLKNKTNPKVGIFIFLTIAALVIFLISYNPKEEVYSLTTTSPSSNEMLNASIDSTDIQKKESDLITFKKSIEIINYHSSEPNSAGGVDCNIIWKNLSDTTIKYATFTVVPYNKVNDRVMGSLDFKGDGSHDLIITGPIQSKQIDGHGTHWSCVWYNSSIDYIKIIKIKIEYIDGRIITTSDIDIIEKLGYSRKPNVLK